MSETYLNGASNKFDLLGYLNRRNIEYTENDTQYILKVCPSCGDDRSKFYINKTTKQFLCFICGFGQKKNLAHLLALWEGIGYHAAYHKIRGVIPRLPDHIVDDELVRELAYTFKSSVMTINGDLPVIELPPNFIHANVTNDGTTYLQSRGINFELANKFNIRYCEEMKRVIFPVNMYQNTVGWQGRDVTNRWQEEKSYPKALTSKGFRKSRMLYGFDIYFHESEIMLVEGPIDAIKGHKCNAMAMFGKSMSQVQFDLLRQMPNLKKIVIALDPDAQEEINKTCKRLIPFFEVYLLQMPVGRDVGSYSPEEVVIYKEKNLKKYNHLTII